MGMHGRVNGFQPAQNGFTFTNSFPPAPAVTLDLGPLGPVGLGDASQGVCGGMAFAVRDFFEAGRPVPALAQPPAEGTPLFRFITQRLLDSFDVPDGVLRYADWMVAADADIDLLVATRSGTFSRTVRQTWPSVRADIDAGHPSPLGLVTVHTTDLKQIGKCHQVLAYGYDVDDAGAVTLAIYDPNTSPDQADDVWIRFDGAHPGHVSMISHNINIGEPTLHGFFRSIYSAKVPPVV
ncbi:MAG: hypothetical protein JWM76_4510 [Pseudonocardiales bacterium]|nr:hypothetical protein [Pseudonocardiales bacterium]